MKKIDKIIENYFAPAGLKVKELLSLIEGEITEQKTKEDRKTERQEKALVEGIKMYASQDNPVNLLSSDENIENVVDAYKVSGCNKFGCEPYTDVAIITSSGKIINVSCKGTSAPSIAGGGLLGAKALLPSLIPKFLEAAEQWYMQSGYNEGDLIPDLYGVVNDKDKLLAVVGTEEIGGPIDFMYVGPMEVELSHDPENKTLTINGKLTAAKKYAQEHDIYMRIRKRRWDQPFVPGEKDKHGYPLLLGRSPSKGDIGRRIVFVNKVPKTREVVEF
jgi:hypothetical protein